MKKNSSREVGIEVMDGFSRDWSNFPKEMGQWMNSRRLDNK
jgi:hypothetical protein